MERPTTPPQPPLSDGLVTLRPWHLEDVPALVSIFNGDDELAYWIDRVPQPFTEDDAREEVEKAERAWRGEELQTQMAVVDAETGEVEADKRNKPSLRVAEKVGFRKEGVLRSMRTNARDGRRVDHVLYSLLRSELVREEAP